MGEVLGCGEGALGCSPLAHDGGRPVAACGGLVASGGRRSYKPYAYDFFCCEFFFLAATLLCWAFALGVAEAERRRSP